MLSPSLQYKLDELRRIVTAMESVNLRDLDGLNVSFSRSSRSLVRLVDISMISRDNRLIN